MALVSSIERIEKDREAPHKPVSCGAYIGTDRDNRRYLLLETYGSADRQVAGKISQSLRFTREAAAQLKQLIAEAFPDLT